MPDVNILKKNNPSGIAAGQHCYAIHLPSFSPCAKDRATLEILEGTLQEDYDNKPADGMPREPCYFLPDEPVKNTDVMSGFYHLAYWQAFPSKMEASMARAALAKSVIAACRVETDLMQGFL